jgi:hypothetical protein
LKAEITKLRRENGNTRTAAKQKAAEEARQELAQTIGKALGLVEDEAADPARLAEQVANSTAEARQARLELAVYRAAGLASVDAAALLDSRTFLEKVADIDLADHLAMQAAIGDAVTANPALAQTAAPRPPAPNPALGSSGAGAPDQNALIEEAKKKGDYKLAIHLENQKLAAPAQR